MLIGVRARGGRRSRIPKHSRLQGSTRPEPLGLEPTPFPRVPGSPVLAQRARGSRSQSADAAAGASSKQTLPAPPGAQLPGPSRAGRGRTVPRRQPAARPPGPVPVPRRPLVSPRSGRPPPGADPLGAGSGQPGSPHTSTCAPPSARPASKSAPPLVHALSLARARGPRRCYRDRRGSARCRRIVSRLPYISSRALGSGTRGRALRDKPLLLLAPSQQSTGGDSESPPHPCWLLSPAPLVPIPHK